MRGMIKGKPPVSPLRNNPAPYGTSQIFNEEDNLYMQMGAFNQASSDMDIKKD